MRKFFNLTPPIILRDMKDKTLAEIGRKVLRRNYEGQNPGGN